MTRNATGRIGDTWADIHAGGNIPRPVIRTQTTMQTYARYRRRRERDLREAIQLGVSDAVVRGFGWDYVRGDRDV